MWCEGRRRPPGVGEGSALGRAPSAAHLAADREHAQKVVPAASLAAFDDIGGEIVGPVVQLAHLGLGGHDAPVGRKSGPEHIRDQHQLVFVAYRAGHRRRLANIRCGPHQLGMGIADLVAPEPASAVFVDQRSPGKTMVDDGTARTRRPSKCTGAERHWAVTLSERCVNVGRSRR